MARSGRCHCGAFQYELLQDEIVTMNCHCRNCRRANGGAFSTMTPIDTANFRVVAGAEVLRSFQTPTGFRFFCGKCGGRLFTRPDKFPNLTNVLVGTLDEEPSQPPIFHANIESMAPWYRILDEIPQHEALPVIAPGPTR